MTKLSLAAAIAVTFPYSTVSLAQAPTDAQAPAAGGAQQVVVNGSRFLAEDTSGITNLPLPIEKVPQSISELSNAFVKAADLKNTGELAQYTTGALWASYSPSYGNQLFLRGFSANYAIDGLTVGDQITEPDVATLERYEIVKGPASVVYGAQSPGGIANLVSKSARANTPSYVEVEAGSWGRKRLEGQAAGRLDDSGSVRAIGVAALEDDGSFVDHVKNRKAVLYGGLDFDLRDDLTGYVRASYQRTEDTPYNGIPTYANGVRPDVSRSYFLGGSDFHAIAQATRLDGGLSWQITRLWSADVKSVWQHTNHGGDNAYPYSTIAADGSFPIGGEDFESWHVDDYTIGVSTLRKLDDLGLKDSSVSANVRYQHYQYSIHELGLSGTQTPNLFDGDTAVSAVFNSLTPNPASSYQQDQRMNYLTASSQAVVKVASPLTLVGGVAWSQPRIDQQVNGSAFQNFNPGHQVNYRAAAVLEAAQGLNFYTSYSESYQPNLRVDTNFNVLAPVKGTQVEVGAKYLVDKRLLLTAALFDIRERNIAVFDEQVGIEALYRAENVRHRGAELEATGTLSKAWQVRGGVSVLDATVTHDPEHPVNDGETRPWLPRTSANVFTTYAVGDQLAFGGGARYVGSVKTYDNSSAAPTLAIPSYTVFDASADYAAGRWKLQLNLKNLFDRHYYVPTPVFQSLAAGLYPGEPRSIAVSAHRDF